MSITRLVYVLAHVPSHAARLARAVTDGKMPAMATTPDELLRLHSLHPLPARQMWLPYHVYVSDDRERVVEIAPWPDVPAQVSEMLAKGIAQLVRNEL